MRAENDYFSHFWVSKISRLFMNGLQSTASASRKVKKSCHDHYIHRDWNVENSTLAPIGRALGRALSCLELMRTRAPPVERLSYRACDSVNFLFGDVRVFRRFWAFLQLHR